MVCVLEHIAQRLYGLPLRNSRTCQSHISRKPAFVQSLQICVRVRFEIFCAELTLTRAIGDRLTAYSRIYFPETITGDTLIIGEC